ncbi:MAG: hypothetical protein VYC12_04270, partial [Candidatus Thermoplasmatota archaeon]|nr:hypothetical protein [Candidatus Thermoplasmatota archaeon]
IDTDLDGIIDIPIAPNQGTTLVGVDNSTVKDTFNLISSETCDAIDVAFIAVDEHGASTAEFMHFLGFNSCDEEDDDDDDVWSDLDYCVLEYCSLSCVSDPEGPACQDCTESHCSEDDDDGPVFITFSGVDAPAADGAAIVTMDSGSDLEWSYISIRVSVDDAAPVTVLQCADGETENCWSSTDSETDYWNVGEAIWIYTDCTSVCTVAISILNSVEGVTIDTIMVEIE